VLAVGVAGLVGAPLAQAATTAPGTMTISAGSVPAGSTGNTFTLRYTAPAAAAVSGSVGILVPTSGAPSTGFQPAPAGTNVTVQRLTCTSAALAGTPFTTATKTNYPGDAPGTRINIVANCPAGRSFTVTYTAVTAPRSAKAYTFFTTIGTLPLAAQPVETVAARAATSLYVAAPTTATAGSPFSLRYTAKDVYGNNATSYRGVVGSSSTDPGATVLPANYTFTSADRGTHTFAGVILRTTGNQRIVARDTVNAAVTGSDTVPVSTAGHAAFVWGANGGGELGDGTQTIQPTPVQMGSDTSWASIAAGRTHTAALKADGSLWAWGHNEQGQLGDGTTTLRATAVRIGTATNWASVSAGWRHTLAVKTDGTLWAWGYNVHGQLGDGTTTDRHSPVRVGTDTHWASVSASRGDGWTVARKTDGTLWAWGNNDFGNLGVVGDDLSTPTQVGTDTHWASVVAASLATVAIKTDGTLWAWGVNAGSGPTGQVGTDTDWTGLAGGEDFQLALKADGTLWGWGSNVYGQLGDGTTEFRATPVRVGTDIRWACVAAGLGHTVAIRTDGSLWSWGENRDGSLGDGTTVNRSTPGPVGPTSTHWTSVVAGSARAFALRQ